MLQKSPRLTEALVRKSAEQSFHSSWLCATQLNQTAAPRKRTDGEITYPYHERPNVSPEVAASMAPFLKEQRKEALNRDTRMHKTLCEIHRRHLIKFFTISKLPLALAEKIVDDHILRGIK